MAIPSVYPLRLTGDGIIDAAIHGYYWHLGADRTIKWSLSNGFNGEFWSYPTETVEVLTWAFSTYAYYANVNFQYAGYFSSPTAASDYADINISSDANFKFFDDYSSWARGYFPVLSNNAGVYQGAPGDIFLNINSDANYLNSYLPGSAGYFLLLHEIGHTLGLKHPHDSGGTGHPTLSQIGLGSFDRDWFSVMSYEDNFNLNLISWDPASPMLLDVLGLQYLYGPNTTTNSTNSIYTLPLNNLYATIWDAGGYDAVDVSSSTVGWTISLPDLQLSQLVKTNAGLAVPTSELSLAAPHSFYWLTGDIESVYGSRFADALEGSRRNDLLVGNGGNDTIDGAGGLDTVQQSGKRANYTVTKTGTGYSIKDNVGFDGTDTLVNIERIKFNDTALAFDINGNAGQAYRLYQAGFDRKPDLSGLGFWINAIDQGVTLQSVASSFITSPEFQTLYGANLTNGALLTAVYKNVLHRAPDQAGYDWWMEALAGGNLTGSQLLVDFSESGENKLQVIGSIQNGIDYTVWAG